MDTHTELVNWITSLKQKDIIGILTVVGGFFAVITSITYWYERLFKKINIEIEIKSHIHDREIITFEAECCDNSITSLNKNIVLIAINPISEEKFFKYITLKGKVEKYIFAIDDLDRSLEPYTRRRFDARLIEDDDVRAENCVWSTFREYIFLPTKGSEIKIFTDTSMNSFREAGAGTVKPVSRIIYFFKLIRFRLFGILKFRE